MPMYDRRCTECPKIMIDCYEPVMENNVWCVECNAPTERVRLPGTTGGVVGDECDITIRHGMCNDDGTPRRWRSREELRKAEKKAGWVNYVSHQAGDKNVARWI